MLVHRWVTSASLQAAPDGVGREGDVVLQPREALLLGGCGQLATGQRGCGGVIPSTIMGSWPSVAVAAGDG